MSVEVQTTTIRSLQETEPSSQSWPRARASVDAEIEVVRSQANWSSDCLAGYGTSRRRSAVIVPDSWLLRERENAEIGVASYDRLTAIPATLEGHIFRPARKATFPFFLSLSFGFRDLWGSFLVLWWPPPSPALVGHRLLGIGVVFIPLNSAPSPPSIRMHLPSQNLRLKDKQTSENTVGPWSRMAGLSRGFMFQTRQACRFLSLVVMATEHQPPIRGEVGALSFRCCRPSQMRPGASILLPDRQAGAGIAASRERLLVCSDLFNLPDPEGRIDCLSSLSQTGFCHLISYPFLWNFLESLHVLDLCSDVLPNRLSNSLPTGNLQKEPNTTKMKESMLNCLQNDMTQVLPTVWMELPSFMSVILRKSNRYLLLGFHSGREQILQGESAFFFMSLNHFSISPKSQVLPNSETSHCGFNVCCRAIKDRRGSPNTNPGANSPSSTKARNASKSGKNFHYITILRDPVSRYLSEWRHVQRGATWKASLHVCDGRPPTSEELPSCYTGDDWSGCPLKEFMDCPYNLANNRQVRMLSDLTLVGCYNLSVMPERQRNKVLLESAKSNLKHMAFFGLTEFQRKTQYLFEKTFNMNFISPFTQYNTTRASSVEINEEIQKRIEGLNFLDMELYSYAKDLFLQRYQFMRQKEHQEARQKRQEQRKFLKGRFLQTHFQSQGQSQSQSHRQNPSQNLSQNPNLSANQNVTQNLIQNLTQNSSQKENRESHKQNPGQEQSDGSASNSTSDYIGSVEKWR
ncbi:hypothetical protein GH733_019455 [Mirounga leonina]|nr:hypothetical protein GH733_019455 [Mirounga leonina]